MRTVLFWSGRQPCNSEQNSFKLSMLTFWIHCYWLRSLPQTCMYVLPKMDGSTNIWKCTSCTLLLSEKHHPTSGGMRGNIPLSLYCSYANTLNTQQAVCGGVEPGMQGWTLHWTGKTKTSVCRQQSAGISLLLLSCVWVCVSLVFYTKVKHQWHTHSVVNLCITEIKVSMSSLCLNYRSFQLCETYWQEVMWTGSEAVEEIRGTKLSVSVFKKVWQKWSAAQKHSRNEKQFKSNMNTFIVILLFCLFGIL